MGLNGLGGESNKEPMEIERIWISIWPSLVLFLALVGTFGNPAFFLGKSEEKKIQRGEKRKIWENRKDEKINLKLINYFIFLFKFILPIFFIKIK